ncbi:MAG: cytidylate kinase [Candidatus Hydrogenedentota bacterium]|nr:MAG: cytidylate kinase [Candidatus Hydrogenedentota bacterium]
MTTQIITIDGPAGAGKSTIAKAIAKALDYTFLDTGAMYRAATWWAMHNDIDLENPTALITNTTTLPLSMSIHDGSLHVEVNHIDVTQKIRTPEVTKNIRKLDGLPEIRQHLTALQQDMGSQQPTVAEGRDMGTVVFPQAPHKFFLDASLDERTRRRAEEMTQKGIAFNIGELRDEIHTRDENDRNRTVAPLKPADDAHIIDTSNLTINEVIQTILKHISS